ncbi:hypothetical protein [Mycobacterium sp. GA-1999]|uniref:hypothetical protein n=1 Tax=Mycobacterium sp. GA-1999 TaxID=1772275 RepID=UPI001E5E9033|nr:hypothetical protein [Mycobacterium sp. GA-1999]
MKRIGMHAALIGALAVTALGVGSGVANAEQPVPNTPGMTWKLDKWDDWDDRGWRGPRWEEPRYWNGPHYGGPCAWVPPAVSMWVPPAAC